MKLAILGVWAAGCAVGAATAVVSLSSGCIGKAHADSAGSVMSAPCSTQGTANGQPAAFAVLPLPGRTAQDLALNVVRFSENPNSTANVAIPGGMFYQASDFAPPGGVLVSDGAVAVQCSAGPSAVVTFLVR